MTTRGEGRVLPAPATQQDMYLAAIVEELERLNANIEQLRAGSAAEPKSDVVELREPEPQPRKAAHRDAKQAEVRG